MKAVAHTAARQTPASTMDWVCEEGAPVLTARAGEHRMVYTVQSGDLPIAQLRHHY